MSRLKKNKYGETPVAEAAFELFVSMPRPRLLRDAAKLTGHSLGTVEQWSMRHDWQNRAAQRDIALARRERSYFEADVREVNALLMAAAKKRALALTDEDFKDAVALATVSQKLAPAEKSLKVEHDEAASRARQERLTKGEALPREVREAIERHCVPGVVHGGTV